MPIEILVEVKNGVVVGVYCNDPNATVSILDRDGEYDPALEQKIDELNEIG